MLLCPNETVIHQNKNYSQLNHFSIEGALDAGPGTVIQASIHVFPARQSVIRITRHSFLKPQQRQPCHTQPPPPTLKSNKLLSSPTTTYIYILNK